MSLGEPRGDDHYRSARDDFILPIVEIVSPKHLKWRWRYHVSRRREFDHIIMRICAEETYMFMAGMPKMRRLLIKREISRRALSGACREIYVDRAIIERSSGHCRV